MFWGGGLRPLTPSTRNALRFHSFIRDKLNFQICRGFKWRLEVGSQMTTEIEESARVK